MGDILEEASRLARERWEATDPEPHPDGDGQLLTYDDCQRVQAHFQRHRRQLERKQARRKAYARWRIVPFCAFFAILLLCLLDIIPESLGEALILSLVAVVLIVEVWVG